jgi:hypothetical protein
MKVWVQISLAVDKDFSVGTTKTTFNIAEMLLGNRVIFYFTYTHLYNHEVS